MPHALDEKTLHSDLIYDGRVVHLYVDNVQLPNAKTARREVVRHPGAVAIIPIDADGKIIMVEQFRYPIGRALLEIPAGTLNPGEDPDLCAIRELQEEIGYKPGSLDKIGGIYLAPGYSSEFIHLYLAKNLVQSQLTMDEDEFIEISRLTFDDVLKKMASGEIADAKTISAILLARDLLGHTQL